MPNSPAQWSPPCLAEPLRRSAPQLSANNSAGRQRQRNPRSESQRHQHGRVRRVPDTMTRATLATATRINETVAVTASACSAGVCRRLPASNLLGNSFSYPLRWNTWSPRKKSNGLDPSWPPLAAHPGTRWHHGTDDHPHAPGL